MVYKMAQYFYSINVEAVLMMGESFESLLESQY